jgi:hypothetical protein
LAARMDPSADAKVGVHDFARLLPGKRLLNAISFVP